jgi:mannonate dehydratase
MNNLTRRDCIHGTFGALAALQPSIAPAAQTGSGRGIQLSELLGPGETSRFRLCRQIGITHAIAGVEGALRRVPKTQYVEELTKIKTTFEAAGLKIAGVEGHPVPAEKIKAGVAGRDQEIDNYIAAVEALGKVGIPMVCYNFMAGVGWFRTKSDRPERGGALTTEFDYEAAAKLGPTPFGEIDERTVWANMQYFQEAVMPVAERACVQMALHPDDPPLARLRGVSRIAINAANYRRIMKMVPGQMNGVTFCQANFRLMGEKIESLAEEWLKEKKLFFVHFRDVAGTKEQFHETFHDNGPTNMVRMLEIYSKHGFNGPMRPEHAPILEGEGNDRPGYGMNGKVLAIGYMKGIMDALGLPYVKEA